jgi:hypothetical protein
MPGGKVPAMREARRLRKKVLQRDARIVLRVLQKFSIKCLKIMNFIDESVFCPNLLILACEIALIFTTRAGSLR